MKSWHLSLDVCWRTVFSTCSTHSYIFFQFNMVDAESCSLCVLLGDKTDLFFIIWPCAYFSTSILPEHCMSCSSVRQCVECSSTVEPQSHEHGVEKAPSRSPVQQAPSHGWSISCPPLLPLLLHTMSLVVVPTLPLLLRWPGMIVWGLAG